MTVMGLLSPGQPQPEPTPDPEPVQSAPDIRADAAALLSRFNVPHSAVVSVSSDSIMFVAGKTPRTAWIGMRAERIVACVPEHGFTAEPTAWTCRRLAQEGADGYAAWRFAAEDAPADGPTENTD